MKPYQKLECYWKEKNANVSTIEISESVVKTFEEKNTLIFPNDFREYLLRCCPKDDFCYDRETTWWPFGRLKSILEEYKHEVRDPAIMRQNTRYIFFADYSIWSWAWAIDCGYDENRGRVAVICGYDRLVADSFSHFVDLYIDNPMRISPT